MICDTHMHFYDSRYRVAEGAVLRPPDATVCDYRELQATLGLERVVVVQPTTYGLDNSCQLDAVAELGDAARAVVVIDPTVTDERLAELTRLGARGARFHMLAGGALSWDALEPVAAKIAPFGWHVQLQMNGRDLADYRDRLAGLACGLVIDHVARFMPPVQVGSAEFAVLTDLVDAGAFVKLSAPYESAPDGDHRYEAVSALAAALVARAPDRMLWATNWPHPGQADPPTAAQLVRLREEWLGSEPVRRQVLVTNPARLYDF